MNQSEGRRMAATCATAAWLAVATTGCAGPEAAAPTTPAATAAAAPATHDAALARALGADALGMRSYVLVVLKTGPHRVPDGPERSEMFRGHFANMKRLSDAGQLVLAGPLDGADGWRGLYVFAVADLDEARRLVATDPVVVQGEMVPELHRWYGSAALMQVPAIHARIARESPR
jgi:uncharacterized protein YciI